MEQFMQIKAQLESARKKTRPREVDLYEVFCAVLYVLRSGCQWRMLPEGFPKWRTVYAYWRIWSAANRHGSLLQRVLKKIGWRGPCQLWTQRVTQSAHPRRPEREERRHRRVERL
jgi:transposase